MHFVGPTFWHWVYMEEIIEFHFCREASKLSKSKPAKNLEILIIIYDYVLAYDFRI